MYSDIRLLLQQHEPEGENNWQQNTVDEAIHNSHQEADQPRQMRRRQSFVSYTEPSLSKKLRNGDEHTFSLGERLGSLLLRLAS